MLKPELPIMDVPGFRWKFRRLFHRTIIQVSAIRIAAMKHGRYDPIHRALCTRTRSWVALWIVSAGMVTDSFQFTVLRRGRNPWRTQPSRLYTPITCEKWFATIRSRENSSQFSGANRVPEPEPEMIPTATPCASGPYTSINAESSLWLKLV